MKTPIFRTLVSVLLISANSCKNEPYIDYKYAESPKILACEFDNGKLYNEAIHSFENDIIAFYDKTNNNNKATVYNGFINSILNNRIKIEDIASKHSLDLAMVLKKETKLWNMGTTETTINYSHPIVDCIANNIKTLEIKQTFNALLATNSMRKNVVLPSLQGYSRSIPADGSLISFLAFEYYYPKLWDLKLEDLKTPVNTNNKVDFNKTPVVPKVQPTTEAKKTENDPHAGHNHD